MGSRSRLSWAALFSVILAALVIAGFGLVKFNLSQHSPGQTQTAINLGGGLNDCSSSSTDGLPVPFDQTNITYKTVTVDNSDDFNQKLAEVEPGTELVLKAGNYTVTKYLTKTLVGSKAQPIKITAEKNGDQYAGVNLTSSLDSILRFSGPQYLVIEGLTFNQNSRPVGLMIDNTPGNGTAIKQDGGQPGHCVVLRNNHFTGTGGIDCARFVGVQGLIIVGNEFDSCGSPGNGIESGAAADLICVANAVAYGQNWFHDLPTLTFQIRTHSQNVILHGNRFSNIKNQALMLGGEASDQGACTGNSDQISNIQVLSNVIESAGSNNGSVIGFNDCSQCSIANNTFIDPGVNLLSSTNGSGNLNFINNLMVTNNDFQPSFLEGTPSVSNNFWYKRGSDQVQTALQGKNDITGIDPELTGMGNDSDPTTKDSRGRLYYRPKANDSPVLYNGLKNLALPIDFDGRKYNADKPAIGAFECECVK